MLAHGQLRALGYSAEAIRHRVAGGRLHGKYRGVYAVGRPGLTRYGRWMAAVLAFGQGASLSHHSAAELHGIRPRYAGPVHVTVPVSGRHAQSGIALRLVETEGLTHHRTPAQQARDRVRDQAHVASGWTVLRFTHA